VLSRIVEMFRQGLNRRSLLVRYFKKMEQTASRNVSIMLSRMRSLVLADRDKEVKALKLEAVLAKSFRTVYSHPLEQMKSDWSEGC